MKWSEQMEWSVPSTSATNNPPDNKYMNSKNYVEPAGLQNLYFDELLEDLNYNILYLNFTKLLQFLESNQTELCFPFISKRYEEIFKRIALDVNVLKSKGLNSYYRDICDKIINSVTANKYIFLLACVYESRKEYKNVLVFKKIYFEGDPVSSSSSMSGSLESLDSPSCCSMEDPYEAQTRSSSPDILTKTFKLQSLEILLGFVKNNSFESWTFRAVSPKQMEFLRNLLDGLLSDAKFNASFSNKRLYTAVWEALKIHSSKFCLKFAPVKFSDHTNNLVVTKVMKSTKMAENSDLKPICPETEIAPREPRKPQSQKKINKKIRAAKRIESLPQQYVIDTLERIITFISDPAEASLIFQPATVLEQEFLRSIKTISLHPQKYALNEEHAHLFNKISDLRALVKITMSKPRSCKVNKETNIKEVKFNKKAHFNWHALKAAKREQGEQPKAKKKLSKKKAAKLKRKMEAKEKKNQTADKMDICYRPIIPPEPDGTKASDAPSTDKASTIEKSDTPEARTKSTANLMSISFKPASAETTCPSGAPENATVLGKTNEWPEAFTAPRMCRTGPAGRPALRRHTALQLQQALAVPVQCDKAMKMMRGMGWSGGALGARGTGITEPIMPSLDRPKGAGLGHWRLKPPTMKIDTDCNPQTTIVSDADNQPETDIVVEKTKQLLLDNHTFDSLIEKAEKLGKVKKARKIEKANKGKNIENMALDMAENMEIPDKATKAEIIDEAENIEKIDEAENIEKIVITEEIAQIDLTEKMELIDMAENMEIIDKVTKAEIIDEAENIEKIDEAENIEKIDEAENIEKIDEAENIEKIVITEEIAQIDLTENMEIIDKATKAEIIDEAENIEKMVIAEKIAQIDLTENMELIDIAENMEIIDKAEKIAQIDLTDKMELNVMAEKVEIIDSIGKAESVDKAEKIEKIDLTKKIDLIDMAEKIEIIYKDGIIAQIDLTDKMELNDMADKIDQDIGPAKMIDEVEEIEKMVIARRIEQIDRSEKIAQMKRAERMKTLIEARKADKAKRIKKLTIDEQIDNAEQIDNEEIEYRPATFHNDILTSILGLLSTNATIRVMRYHVPVSRRHRGFLKYAVRALSERYKLSLSEKFEPLMDKILDLYRKQPGLVISATLSSSRKKIVLSKQSVHSHHKMIQMRKKRKCKDNNNASGKHVVEDDTMSVIKGLESVCRSKKAFTALKFRVVILLKVSCFVKSEVEELEVRFNKELQAKQRNYIQTVIEAVNTRLRFGGTPAENALSMDIKNNIGSQYLGYMFNDEYTSFTLNKYSKEERFKASFMDTELLRISTVIDLDTFEPSQSEETNSDHDSDHDVDDILDPNYNTDEMNDIIDLSDDTSNSDDIMECDVTQDEAAKEMKYNLIRVRNVIELNNSILETDLAAGSKKKPNNEVNNNSQTVYIEKENVMEKKILEACDAKNRIFVFGSSNKLADGSSKKMQDSNISVVRFDDSLNDEIIELLDDQSMDDDIDFDISMKDESCLDLSMTTEKTNSNSNDDNVSEKVDKETQSDGKEDDVVINETCDKTTEIDLPSVSNKNTDEPVSDGGESHKPAKEKPNINSELKNVYLVGNSYPQEMLSKERAKEIQKLISDNIKDAEELPLFMCQGFQNGALIYSCYNQKSLAWLKDTLSSTDVKILDAKTVQRVAVKYFCLFEFDAEYVFKMIELYNKELSTKNWVVEKSEMFEDYAIFLVKMDEYSIEYIHSCNLALFAGLDRVEFCLMWE